MQDYNDVNETNGLEIAIVGMSGRFPGAENVDEFWRNIRDGVESVTRFTDDQLRELGISNAVFDDPSYVKAGIMLEGIDQFDAAFFSYTPRDAERLDPQQRIFLECAWEALEHAGYDPAQCKGSVGVYAGSGASLYWVKNLLPLYPLESGGKVADLLGLMTGNSPDSLCTRVAYKLNLRGPAVTIQTACSTSLMAVHTACQSLLAYECDMALAGGVSLNLVQKGGYYHQAGAIFSADGHCRAFDAAASGTLLGSGAGILVLKRLDDALRDNDTVYAVIKGSAANNDGADKVGYTAPGIRGQADVICAAQLVAGVEPDTVSYIEAHGTGTVLGDPIELAALTRAFRSRTARRNFCAIGSVKTNIGHLDAAAGVAGLIKTVMALKHQVLPASLNFVNPNPEIDFTNSPFHVNHQTRPWSPSQYPRRAGVSSFGIGGTNVHVILEEAPSTVSETVGVSDGDWIFLPISANSEHALQQAQQRLANHLELHPEQSLVDVAKTLITGRKRFAYRAAALARTREEAIATLRTSSNPWLSQGVVLSTQTNSSGQIAASGKTGAVFLFPGQGSQYVDMGRFLYETAPVFREVMDECCSLLEPELGLDLRLLIYPPEAMRANAEMQLRQTAFTQPSLFVVEYAMARQWMAWGLQPEAMLGHSIGEYVAACLSGVFDLHDALRLIVRRAQLLQSTETGSMLAVHIGEVELPLELTNICDLAAVNSNRLCVLAGTDISIDQAELILAQRGIGTQRLHVSHAFHSSLVEPVLKDFLQALEGVSLHAPQIPFVSNVTGEWITAAQACSPQYWALHLRQTVRFHDGLTTLLAKGDWVVLEVGPGETLSAFTRRHPSVGPNHPVLSSQCHPDRREHNKDQPALCVTRLWAAGLEMDYSLFFNCTQGKRISLPSYPFERQSFWVHPPEFKFALTAEEMKTDRSDLSSWLYVPTWKSVTSPGSGRIKQATCSGKRVLVLGNQDELTTDLHTQLLAEGYEPILAIFGQKFESLAKNCYSIRASEQEDFKQLLRTIPLGDLNHICHLFSLNANHDVLQPEERINRSFYSLLALVQALDMTGHSSQQQSIALTVITNSIVDVTGNENICAENATLQGMCQVAPREYPQLSCRIVDVAWSNSEAYRERLVRQLLAEMKVEAGEPLIALRGPHRWIKTFTPLHNNWPEKQRLRDNGVYLITGGTGGIGLTLANYLARNWRARLVLVGRSELPPRNRWSDLLLDDSLNSSLRKKLEELLDLESTGSDFLLLQADVADYVQVEQMIEQAEQHFGRIDGVIHAAGNPGGGVIAKKTFALADAVLASKVKGARNLVTSLADKAPDFLLLCSSLTAIVPTFGQADYCAANCYLDALSCKHSWVLSVNWDTWRDVGMAAKQRLPMDVGIPSERGGQLVERLLSYEDARQIAVSRIELAHQFHQINTFSDRLSIAPQIKSTRKERPVIATSYIAPASELEFSLADLWSDFLGISPIGVRDNLFELGGDSLLAIQILAKIRATYGIDIHPGEIFKSPTIAQLCELIEIQLIEEIENSETEPGTV